MCGIAGIIDWGRVLGKNAVEQTVRAMRDSMVHRGPDDAGVWIGESGVCALAHRRLSIIDLSAGGRQPMANEDSSVWVTFNGEIYNYKALKEQLQKKGHQFRSNSDTEILPNLFEELNPERIGELDGMFSFGVWSVKKKRLLLAVDRFGKKPLYFAEGHGWFAFASELKALRSLPSFDAAIDKEALALYLLLQYIPAPRTIYSGAKKVEAGHYLEVDFSNGGSPTLKSTCYADFSPNTSTDTSSNFDLRVDRLQEIVISAVDKRLVSDVPLGAFLSGGVDSSLVAAIATKELGRKLKTFTIGFDGAADSEHYAAREISKHLGTEHYEKVLRPDAIALVDEIAARLDEPNGDSSCLPTLLLCQHAREHVTVALSGDGGDEMFGGYGRYRDTLNEQGGWRHQFLRKIGLGDGWTASSAYLSPRWLIFQPEQVASLLGAMPHSVNALLTNWRYQLDNFELPLMHRMRKLDAHTYMPGAVLAKVDRMSMQASLEVRCPLLDRDVAKFAETVSTGECWSPPAETKRMLKQLASRYLPEEWMNRRKLGFGLPANAWSKEDMLFMARERLVGSESSLIAHVNRNVLKALIARQAENNGFSIYQLWPLLIIEAWLRKNNT